MALARRQGTGHSGEVCRDVVRGVDGAVGRRQCQEGVVKGMRHGVAPGVRGSGQGVCPRGERLDARGKPECGPEVLRHQRGDVGVREPWTGVQGACHRLVCDKSPS
jgi:hypothetical protein